MISNAAPQRLDPCCLTCHHWEMGEPGDISEDSAGWCHGRAPGEADELGVARWPITYAYLTCGSHRQASNAQLQGRVARRAMETEDA